MPDRSMIFNAKGIHLGYIEDNQAFDLAGRECCKYARGTSNLTDLNGKVVGYVSLDGTFVGLSWISDKLFGKPTGGVHPESAVAKKRRLHQRAQKAIKQQPQQSSVEEPKDEPSPTATVPQPENPVEHSPITEPGGDLETGFNAFEQVKEEVPVPHREPTVGAQDSTKSAATQDELVDRAIGMIRIALGNGSEA